MLSIGVRGRIGSRRVVAVWVGVWDSLDAVSCAEGMLEWEGEVGEVGEVVGVVDMVVDIT